MECRMGHLKEKGHIDAKLQNVKVQFLSLKTNEKEKSCCHLLRDTM